MNGQSDTCSMLRNNLAVAWQWGVKFLGFHGIGHLFASILAADNMPWLRFSSYSGNKLCQPLKRLSQSANRGHESTFSTS